MPSNWRWTGRDGRSGGVIEDESGDLLIADLTNADNADQNGPLLAAAPELLAALREAEEELSLHMDSAGGDADDMARLRRIREAIHHAMGGRV